MIEINLNKLVGTHKGTVTVHRGGKVFTQQRRLGRKTGLDQFKSDIHGMSDDDLKSQISIIEDKYPEVHKGLENWYTNKSMESFDGALSSVFNMPGEHSRSEKVDVDDNTVEGYKKIYLITQEYLSRTEGDSMICHRGLGPRSYKKYKDLDNGETVDIEQYNVSSWTNDYDIASEFAQLDEEGGVTIEMVVDSKKVFMHPDCASEFSGEYSEGEVIVMGHDINAVMGDVFPGEEEEEDEEDEDYY